MNIDRRLERLEREFPTDPAGPRLCVILMPLAPGQPPDEPPLVRATEADCRRAGRLWIPDTDDRPVPEGGYRE